MSLAQRAILEDFNGNIEEFVKHFGLHHVKHPRYQNLHLLKYRNIGKLKHPEVAECRGLILDEQKDFEPVCRPFDKFYNIFDPREAKLDWKYVDYYLKMDGTLCNVWFYDKEWRISTTGTPDAGGFVGQTTNTFRDLFWDTVKSQRIEFPNGELNRSITFMFELVGPENRIIVRYEKPALILIGARFRTGREINVENASSLWKLPCVTKFPLTSKSAALEEVRKFNPYKAEGLVAVDQYFKRVKIKSPLYTLIHQFKDLSQADILVKLLTDEIDNRSDLPEEIKDSIDQLEQDLVVMLNKISATYKTLEGISDQKTFALEAKKHSYQHVLFA